MKRLFVNEWVKMKYSKLLWILLGGILALMLLMGIGTQGAPDKGYWYVGGTASFEYMRTCGSIVILLLAPMVGIFFTQELQQGTMHNTLSCGVSRSRYFAVKTICILASGLVFYLSSLLLYVGVRTLCVGFAPVPGTYPDMGLAVAAVFQLGCCVQIFTYITCFILVSVLTQKTAFVNLAGLVVWVCESFLAKSVPSWRGPLGSIIASQALWAQGKVLTAEFLLQSVQCAVMSVVFLALGYLVFMKRDIS